MDRLFVDFAQLDQSPTRRHGGRGLGLALVKRIVTRMRGDVGVRSTVGEGSEVWFDVPLSSGGAQHTSHTQSAAVARTQKHRIADLTAALGRDKAEEIIEACFDAAWTLTETIEIARRGGDVAAIGRAAHDLKSTAGNIGMRSLESCASAIDDAVRAGDAEKALELAALLPGETATAQTELVDAYPQFASAVTRMRAPSSDKEVKAS